MFRTTLLESTVNMQRYVKMCVSMLLMFYLRHTYVSGYNNITLTFSRATSSISTSPVPSPSTALPWSPHTPSKVSTLVLWSPTLGAWWTPVPLWTCNEK